MSKFKPMYFRIGEDPHLPKIIQKCLFDRGYTWGSGSRDFLYLDDCRSIRTYSNGTFSRNGCANDELLKQEVDIDWMRTSPEPVEVFGKKYDPTILQARLADCLTVD